MINYSKRYGETNRGAKGTAAAFKSCLVNASYSQFPSVYSSWFVLSKVSWKLDITLKAMARYTIILLYNFYSREGIYQKLLRKFRAVLMRWRVSSPAGSLGKHFNVQEWIIRKNKTGPVENILIAQMKRRKGFRKK